MGDHLGIPGQGVLAKNTANRRPQDLYELKDFGPSIIDGQEQEKSSENTVYAGKLLPETGNVLHAEPPSCPSKRLPSPGGCGVVKSGLPTRCAGPGPMLQEFQLLFICASIFIRHDFVYTERALPLLCRRVTGLRAFQGGLICLPLNSNISGAGLAWGRLRLADGLLPAPSASWPLKGPAGAAPCV